MKMLVIGAGVAGAMASGFFRSKNPEVIEIRSEEEVRGNHKAIFRVKNPEVGLLLGCPLEKIQVHKSIYSRGKHYKEANISFCNSYSLKVAGSLQYRSIENLEPVCDRYKLKDGFAVEKAFYGCGIKKIYKGCIVPSILKDLDYDVAISTIPLPILLKKLSPKLDLGMDLPKDLFKTRKKPIYVTRCKLAIPSEVAQTIYYPDLDIRSYRATIEKGELIIESVELTPSRIEFGYILDSFGITELQVKDKKEEYVQEYGKLRGIDAGLRKHIIFQLTKQFNIYSLGRFALWKNIRADDLLEDLRKIEGMMNQPLSSVEYDQEKER